MEKAKTFREILSELPKPYSDKAIENTRPMLINDTIDGIQTISSALWSAFDWSKTPQSTVYWFTIVKGVDNSDVTAFPGKPYKTGRKWALDYLYKGLRNTIYASTKSDLTNPDINPYI